MKRLLFVLLVGLTIVGIPGHFGLSTVMAATPPATPTVTTEKGSAPPVDPGNFVKQIDNKFLPLPPGTTFVYEGVKGGENQRNEVKVTHETKVILGVTCTVVNDRVTSNGDLVEATLDWYAQDKEGNVWYFGEDAKEYENGKVISTEGSWEAGVNGAEPGIVMEAQPKAGDTYKQEYAKGVAEDKAQVLVVFKGVAGPENFVITEESTPLAPDDVEHKYYVAGIGYVASVKVKGEAERSEFVKIETE